MTSTMDHSVVASAAIEQVLCPRRQITLLEFTSKYQAEFPCAESQETGRAFTSMICIGAFSLGRSRRVRMRYKGRIYLYISRL
jgi:hypothetical protein